MKRDDPTIDELRDLEDAMGVWREDADRTAARVDVAALADRVVARVAERPRLTLAPSTARRYAAAALVLLGVGVCGTLLARGARAEADPTPRWALLEEDLVDVIATDPRYAPSLGVEGR